MIQFIFLPMLCRSLILIILFSLMLFQGFAFFTISVSRGRKSMVLIFTLMSAILLCFLTTGNRGIVLKEEVWDVTMRFSQMPIVVIILFIILSGIYTGIFLRKEIRHQETVIDRKAIKESVDNLPAGLCFARFNGQPYLVNNQMDELSRALTGKSLQNAKDFWYNVIKVDSNASAKRITIAGMKNALLLDGKAWGFMRQIIDLDGQNVVQYIATDISELYKLTCKLKSDNSELKRIGARLKRYGENMNQLNITQERLETKIHIHDAMGQNLIATRHFLGTYVQGNDLHSIMKRWNKTLAVLRRETEAEDHTGAIKYLTDAAEAVGVKILMAGDFPKQGAATEIIVAAGAEALTNAVKHAGANEFHIDISEAEDKYVVVFSNDGKQLQGKISEGGGLSTLRRRIEGIGGYMSVCSKPQFALTVTIPKERDGKI